MENRNNVSFLNISFWETTEQKKREKVYISLLNVNLFLIQNKISLGKKKKKGKENCIYKLLENILLANVSEAK